MIWLLLYPVYSVLAIMLLEVLYLTVMGLKISHETNTLSPIMKLFGNTIFTIGYVWDIWCNLTVTSVWLLDFPREFTVSAKLKRLVNGVDWRAKWAIKISSECLNPFSPGGPHIPIPK